MESVAREKEWQENENKIRLAAMERKIGGLQVDLSRKEEEIQSANVKLREAGDELQRFQAAMRKEMAELRSRGNERVTEMESALESARSENARVIEELQELEDVKVGLQRSVGQWQRKHSHAEEEVNRLTVSNGLLQAQVQQMHTQKRKMETKLKQFKLAAQETPASPSHASAAFVEDRTKIEPVIEMGSEKEPVRQVVKNVEKMNKVQKEKVRGKDDELKKRQALLTPEGTKARSSRSKPVTVKQKKEPNRTETNRTDGRERQTVDTPTSPMERRGINRCEEEKRSEGESPEYEEKSLAQKGRGSRANGDISNDFVADTEAFLERRRQVEAPTNSSSSLKLPRMVTRKFDKDKDGGLGQRQKGSKIRFLHNNEKLPTVFRT